MQTPGRLVYTTIINEIKDNVIHYVAVNSSRNPIIGADLTLGTLILTGKADGKGKVSLNNAQVTASGNSERLAVDTSAGGTLERQYVIGNIDFSPTTSPTPTPTLNTPELHGQCLAICEQGSLVSGTFDKPACIQNCNSRYKQPALTIETSTPAASLVIQTPVADKCQPPKEVSCYPAAINVLKSILFAKWASNEGRNNYEVELCEKGKPFSDSSCESLDMIASDSWFFSKKIEEGKTYRVRTRVSKGDNCLSSDWSEAAECAYVKPTIKLDVDSDVGFVGSVVKATVIAKDDYYGINYIDLDYGFDSITKDDQAISNLQNYYSFKCDGQKLCVKTFLVDTKNYKAGKVNLVASAINNVPSNNMTSYIPEETSLILKKDQPVRFDGKEIELLNVSADEKGSIKKVNIRIGETHREFDAEQLYQMKFIEGMSMRFTIFSFNPLELGLIISTPKTVDLLDLNVVVPGKVSPGTMFTITVDLKRAQKLSLSAKIQSLAHTSTHHLYDDGNHGDDKANDGFYANTISVPKIGTYFVTIVGEDAKGRTEADNVASFTVSDLQSSCVSVIKNGEPKDSIDVVFARNNYAESGTSEVPDAISLDTNFLLSKEPFKSNADKFSFYYLNELSKVDCSVASANACVSLYKKAVSLICPFYDKLIVLDRNAPGTLKVTTQDNISKEFDYGGYAYSEVAVIGEASDQGIEDTILLHEFGHSFGQLADEYEEIRFTSETSRPNCDVFGCPKWCSEKSNLEKPLCYSQNTQQDCVNSVYNNIKCVWNENVKRCDYPYHSGINFGAECKDDTACLYGCGGREGYRSSEYSIMGDTNQGKVMEYNTVSKQQIQKIIDNWGKGK